ncbi:MULTISPECIES: hypothetical protein [Sorangium]|uniref:Porin n=1 Tax=Sorangium cellulosum TaxID=56 RepID=A0A4V0NGG1_SORCE|nr:MULTISPECIES: hypothetical protein [Sorangium]AUX33052.1 hypothetical protein SOCE836_052040 [Sorangium cellulosum]WCQ92427.1 hypothetical protein NQZ70_05168 [Sorangium sp. Soce836]
MIIWKTPSAALAASLALAGVAAPATGRAQTAEPQQPAPAEAAVEPRPAPPPPVEPKKPEDKPLVRVYGIVKPTVVVGNGLESFGNPNYSAPTAAANPVFLADPDAVGLSFQAAQTRFGVTAGEGTPVKGQFEVDFIDFGKSSPAQAMSLRVRQAFVEWSPAEGHKLTLGQLWDLFSPLNTHTYNLVGALFQSGNSGFVRHQLSYVATLGSVEVGAALGLVSQNVTAILNNVEYSRTPTFALRAGYRAEKAAWVGASVIATSLAFDANLPTEERKLAIGGNLFAEVTSGPLNLRAEAYGGQNLANLGLLTLGQGNRATDVAEVGGWVSGKLTFDKHALHLIAGAAVVPSADDMLLGYTPGTPATEGAPATPAARVGGNGPGIERNVTVRAGYAFSPMKGLSLVLEPSLMLTRHKLDPAAEVDKGADRVGWAVEAGGLYQF